MQVPEAQPIELRLLGRFVVLRDGREVPAAEFGGRKVRALLRILATRRGALVTHDALTELLWGERPPADPAANLQVLVNRARRALGRPQLVVTGAGGYALAAGPGCVVDAEQFAAAVETAAARTGREGLDAYAAALAQWAGEPLAEDAYADWARNYRERLVRVRQDALERAAALALELDDTSRAVEFAAAAAAADPLRETATLTLVRALAAAGDPAGALERYDQFRRALADELGVDPSAAAQEVQAELLRGGAPSRPAATVARRPGAFGEAPFVGRSAERAALDGLGERGGLALLLGESGAGKSRLLDGLARRTACVSVRAFRAEQDEPWSLVRSVLREVLAADATAAAALPAATRAALHWLLPDTEMVGAASAPGPESRRALLVEAAARLLEVAGRPLVVDDLQWADATSIAVLEAVLDRLPVAAVLAGRPGEARERAAVHPFLGRTRARAQVIELHPLEVADIARLVGDPALAETLSTATDGTPLAVLEVVRALAEEGMVARTAQGRWRTARPGAPRRAAELAVEGQRRAIEIRVEAVPAGAAELLDMLALLAREVPARVLADAAERDERVVLDQLGNLAQAGLARLGEQGWATGHDLVGEVVVDRLPPDARGRLHGLLARALAAAQTEPGELARHWLGAGDRARAADAYRAAATRALDAFADTDALTLASAGLEVTAGNAAATALHEARAEARTRLGDIAGARADLRTALAAVPGGPLRSLLLSRLARLILGADDLVRSAELAELALVEAGEDEAARAAALEIAAVLDMNLDRPHRAERRAAEALARYERIGDASGTARVLDGRAMARFLDGDITGGTELLTRAANLFEDAGDLLHVITPRSTAGHGLVFAGDPAGGLARTTASLELARTLAHPEGQTYALWHTTEALAALGRADEAAATSAEALAVAQQLGHRGWTATAWRAVGLARLAGGDPEAALVAFEESSDSAANLNLFACWAAARRALVLVALGRPDEAAPLVTRALGTGPALGHYEARLAGVELAAARADPDTAELARHALQRADAGGVRQGRERLVHLAAEAGQRA